MVIKKEDIENYDSKFRLKLINSLSGHKGVHLIGTQNTSQVTNLAIFNSIVHISSQPAKIGFFMRPLTVARNTYQNIIDTKVFTINHVHTSFVKKAHYTSAKFAENQSEFKHCNLKEEYLPNFEAPFVRESEIKFGLKLVEDIEVSSNGERLIIGEVQTIQVKEDYLEEDGQLNLEKSQNVCVTGLNQYSTTQNHMKLPYARVEDVPNFDKKVRPDNIVFDELTQSYSASKLPYGTNIGAPSISSPNLSQWKTRNITSFNHVLHKKVEDLQSHYKNIVKEYETNEIIYNSKFEFEPIVGKTYHLYLKDNVDEYFLSLIPPQSWDKIHVGSYQLNTDHVWKATKA